MADIDVGNFCSPWIRRKDIGWEKVLNLGRKKIYTKGSIIMAGNGELVNDLYYLHSGKVKLSYIAKDGREKILLYIEQGNLFGEVPFFDCMPTYKQFVAVEACEVYAFSRECFEKQIAPKHPELLVGLIKVLVNKARTFSVQASEFESIIVRLCKVLLYMVEGARGGNGSGKISCKHGICKEELACILGTHRATVFAAIAQLKEAGVLEDISKKRILITDYALLVKIAQGG